MREAVAFFYEHAGWAYDPARETPEAGRLRGALALERAERWRLDAGYVVTWGDDWAVGDHRAEYGDAYGPGEPQTCEVACLLDAGDNVLASLGCIDGADDDYRRVIGAELAAEVMPRGAPFVALGIGL